MTREHRFLVAAAMRNEGPFIVEWVSWYRMLGFDHILVATNNCTDHSPELLDALQAVGWVTHITHAPPPGTPPKRSAHRAFREHPLTARTEWLMVCDVDEFLVLHEGDGTIGGFLGDARLDVLGIAFHWKCFGTGGQVAWRDGLVHRTFTRAAPERHRANAWFKSIFRTPLSFGRFGAHGPHRFKGVWGKGGHRWIDTKGRELGNYDATERPQKATAADRVTHAAAQMNHYVLRSEESFGLKRSTLSAAALRDRYSDDFYALFNRNEVEDQSALAYTERFDAVHAEAMALPGVARLHHLCCADYVARLAAKAGRPPEDDPRHAHHLREAAACSG
ncbi:MAG: glycosyltransferase family 2 protein [Rhodobacter sp.]|nr:glycosyltransferase family 2 protein [Rhodobacter sp.]